MSNKGAEPANRPQPVLRKPVPEDAFAVNQLIMRCPPLDGNSVYCNLLQCTHFAETCIAAELEGELVGFISGYMIPERPNTLFIWQVAVAEAARGRGLARTMLSELLQRDRCREVNYLETTITPDNKASRALFQSLAEFLESDCEESILFDRHRHFADEHASECLLRIGPFQTELIGVGPGMEQKPQSLPDYQERTA